MDTEHTPTALSYAMASSASWAVYNSQVYTSRARYIVRREKETIALKCDIYVDSITAIHG